jgi:hypothetical protein
MAASIVSFKDFELLQYNDSRHPMDGIPDRLQVNYTSSWTYCGPLLSLSETELPLTLRTWKNASIKGSLIPKLFDFLSFTHDLLSKENLSHYWLTIRATKATHDYDTPRWHVDEDFFSRDNYVTTGQTQWKLVTTLLGPGTLFIEDGATARAVQMEIKTRSQKEAPYHPCVSIHCKACSETSAVVRTRSAFTFQHYNTVQAEVGQACFLRIGMERGAVHSEPPMSRGDRIFVNIVPGKESELRDLMAKWGMEFPRTWSVGLPIHIPTEDH